MRRMVSNVSGGKPTAAVTRPGERRDDLIIQNAETAEIRAATAAEIPARAAAAARAEAAVAIPAPPDLSPLAAAAEQLVPPLTAAAERVAPPATLADRATSAARPLRHADRPTQCNRGPGRAVSPPRARRRRAATGG